MKTFSVIMVIVGGLLFCPASRANLTGVTLQSDGDGAIQNCPIYTWNGSVSELSAPISGDQCWEPAHVVGTIQTDGTDPSLTLNSSINNDTSFAWTAYIVNVYMNTTFTLSGAGVSSPGDWVTATTQPTLIGGQYEGQLLFSAGTPVATGSQLDFGYTISFGGGTSYSFTQEMIPVPEPGTLEFLAAGVLMLAGILAAGGRTRHS